MPMTRGQRVRELVCGDDATTALAQLANSNPNLAEVVDGLGRSILGLPGVCLRVDGTSTYDLAFVRPRSPLQPGSRRKAFVSFNSPTFGGRWMPAQQDSLRVGVMVNRTQLFQDRLIRRRGPGQGQTTGVWHDVCIGQTIGIPAGAEERQIADVFDVIERAYHSFS